MEKKFNILVNTSKYSPGQPTLSLEPLQKAKKLAQSTPELLFSRWLLEYTLLNFL